MRKKSQFLVETLVEKLIVDCGKGYSQTSAYHLISETDNALCVAFVACQLECCHRKFVGWEQQHRKYVSSRVIKGRLKSTTGNKTRQDYHLQR